MMQEELLNAIGGLNENILAESEEAISAKPKRILWRVAIAVAAAAMLAISVAAAGFILNSTPIGMILKPWKNPDYIGINGDYVEGASSVDVMLEFYVKQDRPKKLEVFYLPQVPETWEIKLASLSKQGTPVQVDAITEDEYMTLRYIWIPEGYDWDQHVMYVQTTVDTFYNYGLAENIDRRAHGKPELIGTIECIRPLNNRTLSEQQITIAGLHAYELTISANPEEAWDTSTIFFSYPLPDGERRFYWYDGDYIFTLVCPSRMTDAEVAALIESIQITEDLPALQNRSS